MFPHGYECPKCGQTIGRPSALTRMHGMCGGCRTKQAEELFKAGVTTMPGGGPKQPDAKPEPRHGLRIRYEDNAKALADLMAAAVAMLEAGEVPTVETLMIAVRGRAQPKVAIELYQLIVRQVVPGRVRCGCGGTFAPRANPSGRCPMCSGARVSEPMKVEI